MVGLDMLSFGLMVILLCVLVRVVMVWSCLSLILDLLLEMSCDLLLDVFMFEFEIIVNKYAHAIFGYYIK